METIEKAKEINKVMTDINLTIAERQEYADTLTEKEMREVFKEMMTMWASKDRN